MEQQDSKLLSTAPATLYRLHSIQRIHTLQQHIQEEQSLGCFTLLVFTRGSGRMAMDQEERLFGQGKCWMLMPGTALSIQSDHHGCTYYQLEFTTSLGQEYGDYAAAGNLLPARPDLSCTPFTKLLELLEDINTYRHAKEELQAFRRYVRFQELLLLLFSQNSDGPDESKGIGSTEQQGVDHSIRHIEQHYRDVLTVEELAAIANIERWKYTRLFKEATGVVPLQFLNDVRINRAKKWLLQGEDKLSEIAQHTGFTNEYYFNRRFKQMVGVSPGQYRRSHREEPRVVAPLLEDFMVALDIMPVVQYSHAKWGKQDYLALHHIPTFDEMSSDFKELSSYNPDFIVLQGGYKMDQYSQCRRISKTYMLPQFHDNWRTLLRTIGNYFGRSERAEEVIAVYEEKAKSARQKLSCSMNGETVAFLRISADHIHQYTHTGRGFASAVLYEDVGLSPYCGGEARAGKAQERMTRLTLEELSTLSADHLFITFDKWHSQAEGMERSLLQHPAWRTLPAVQNNHAYEVDFLTWMNYGVISNGKKIDDILQVLA